jgi:hypothetical protein
LASYEVANGTAGGACPTGTWNVRPLNTLKTDTIGSVAVASNRLSLPAGTYRCAVSAAASNTYSTQLRLYNFTAGTTIAYGMSVKSDYWSDADATLKTSFTLAAPSEIRVDMQCERNYNTNDMGTPTSFAGSPETYMYVECWR